MSLRIESLAIGDELLDGRLTDSNSRFLADVLSPFGVTLGRTTAVGDDVAIIAEALLEAASRADLVVTSGGLGPTPDDLTAEGVARAAGTGLRFDTRAFEQIRARFAARGLALPDNNRRQAELPESSTTLPNDVGVAPAFLTRVGGAAVYSFPGVPREYRHCVETYVLPAVRTRPKASSPVHVVTRTLRCLGMTESGLAAALAVFEAAHDDVRVQYRTCFPENHVRLVVRAATGPDAERRADLLAEEARAAVGGAVYAVGEQELEALLLSALAADGQRLATAESCTGGLIGKRLTDVPGASAAYLGGVISYANDVKAAELGVDPALIARCGAVSEEVAGAMAEGVRRRLGADWGLSTTGIAGPGGGSDDKPVGTVCFGLSGAAGTFTKRRLLPFGERAHIRELAAAISLRWLLTELERGPAVPTGPLAA